jgi:hypothetical protein
MKDFIASVAVCLTASVAATYVIREIDTGFWRSKKIYADAKREMKKQFNRCKPASV